MFKLRIKNKKTSNKLVSVKFFDFKSIDNFVIRYLDCIDSLTICMLGDEDEVFETVIKNGVLIQPVRYMTNCAGVNYSTFGEPGFKCKLKDSNKVYYYKAYYNGFIDTMTMKSTPSIKGGLLYPILDRHFELSYTVTI